MSKSNETQFEVLPTTTGDSWRVRIIEQERTQYINGFESRTQAEHWIVNEAEIWLSELRRLAITPLTRISSVRPGDFNRPILSLLLSRSNTLPDRIARHIRETNYRLTAVPLGSSKSCALKAGASVPARHNESAF